MRITKIFTAKLCLVLVFKSGALHDNKTSSSSKLKLVPPCSNRSVHIEQFCDIAHVYKEMSRKSQSQLDMMDTGSDMVDFEEALVTQIYGVYYSNDQLAHPNFLPCHNC